MLNSWRRTTAALLLFGVSFGFVEAAVVVYLRAIYEPLRQLYLPWAAPGGLFPLITLEQLSQAGPRYQQLLAVELMREAATMALLASIALALSRNLRQGVAAFAIAFGVWDAAFYAFLKLTTGWPPSLFERDLLFLLPAPWVGPVLAPVLVSAAMAACGFLFLWREWNGRPVQTAFWHWLGAVLGGAAIVASFLWEASAAARGELPGAFPWPLFGLGLAAGLAGFAHAWKKPAPARR